MRIAVGSDQRAPVTDVIVAELQSREIDVVLCGALRACDSSQWAEVARMVAQQVSRGNCSQGILFCWTGTGVSIAANKISGVRAALCVDAETARGARSYNDANLLCMSLRLTSPPLAQEILAAWISTNELDEAEMDSIELVKEIDKIRGSDNAT